MFERHPMSRSVRPSDRPVPRYVFVCGLHRSGTSLLAGLLASHPDIAAIENTDAPEQEGVYLQGAIPHTARHGVPGAFAWDPEQHLTEASRYNSLETALRLKRDWDRVFPGHSPWRVEKSPVNLLRTRLYQQLFPLAHFVFITRHPVATARATAKWTTASEDQLVDHWRHAHQLMLDDLPYLHAALVLRYEDLTADPAASLSALSAFLDLTPIPQPDIDIQNRNADYLNGRKSRLPDIALTLGYGRGGAVHPLGDLRCRHHLRSRIRGVLQHVG
ncbi:Sulfotransferase domain protein [Rhodobacteraceae bacterium THAF1]|uniref:sulfotransferase family protein n=1 Tax=Palleronia sp. THAF1 TaxID=2587842 RepID=UPI000F41C7DF|nr:sulfotransferase [Palleronia sp. THAF1]QFU08728.1 Sulfotransferase domain protein [Palleronia sp. THAF1]VDC27026.1 Sulfotransferase domain protein [Rhodobacteraceae bacterium THAF1]